MIPYLIRGRRTPLVRGCLFTSGHWYRAQATAPNSASIPSYQTLIQQILSATAPKPIFEASMATVTPTMPQPLASGRKKIRIVCISDTHNIQLKPPDGDVLIHAGDMTNAGSHTELKKAIEWISGLKHEVKIVVAGYLAPQSRWF